MILKASFLRHWKTEALIKRGGLQAAWSLLHLWAHCEDCRNWRFERMTADRLAAITRWEGDGDILRLLTDAGFVDSDGAGTITVHDWSEHNRALVVRWENGRYGALGGRRNGDDNPTGSHRVASGNPTVTLSQPNPSRPIPSQTVPPNPLKRGDPPYGDCKGETVLAGSDAIRAEKELGRVEKAIERIRGAASRTALGTSYSPEERAELKKLKARRHELVNALGMTV